MKNRQDKIHSIFKTFDQNNWVSIKGFTSFMEKFVYIYNSTDADTSEDFVLAYNSVFNTLQGFINNSYCKGVKGSFDALLNFATNIKDYEFLFHLINGIIASKEHLKSEVIDQDLCSLVDKIKEINYFNTIKILPYQRKLRYSDSLGMLVDYFEDSDNLKKLELVDEFNSNYKFFDFDYCREAIARYYYKIGLVDKSIDYINKEIFNKDCWSGNESTRRLIMRLYIDHGNLDILNNSYKDLKKSIEKDSERGIYSLFDCLFDYTNKYSYTIYDNNQFEEILELALGSYSQKKYHNKNNNINNNEDLESEVYKLIVKTFTVDISPKEFMKSFERSIKRLFAIDASDKNISLTVVDTVHLYEKIIKFSFIDSDDTDSIISNYELNDIPIIQTIDKLQCVIALKEFLENIYSHFRNEKNTNNNLIRHLTDYSNLLEEYTDVMNPGDDQQAQQNYDVERKIREIHQKIKMEKDKCRWMTSDDQLQFGNLYRLDYYLLNENTILSDEILEKEKKIHYIAYRNINKTLKERTDFASNYSPKTNYQSILNLFNHLIPFLGNKLNEEKIEQNNKIYADVSHRIKNIIQSIQTPLLDILDWAEKKQSIKNVVKGTQIISDMVNLSSHSYSASIEDFIYDANNNSNKISIESLIIDSIKKVIPNMFDGKHFNNETRNYFTKKEHEIARKEFADKIENSNELDTIINYLERYFFKTKIDITNSADKKIGNDRNSETKLAIIFVELILNAFKNASYVDKSKRIFSLSTKFDENFTFSISNSYLQKRTIKTTGFGLDSVNRMLISLNGRLAIEKNKIYNTDLIILNIWEGS